MCFNPRAHAGRDGFLSPASVVLQCFNPRAHAGRDRNNTSNTRRDSSFNPRAHAGRDTAGHVALTVYGVSIHAPTRGATPLTSTYVVGCTVSIHAPTRGATRVIPSRDFYIQRFNPRAHAGRDPPRSRR